MIGRALQRLLPTDAAIIAPVPLHRWRIWARGFNQSALIAAELGLRNHQIMVPDLLLRVKFTPKLGGLGRYERAKTVKAAFAVNEAHKGLLTGQLIVLVDDVYTSGATANACARALKKAGAHRVVILCWARVLQKDEVFD